MKEQGDKLLIQDALIKMLRYVGFIGAVITAMAYLIVVIVMIVGFEVHQTGTTLLFAVVNGCVGILIMQLLKLQGIAFAKELPKNKHIAEQYYMKDTKDKKFVSIKRYWLKSVIIDIVLRGASIVISSAGIIFIVVVGSQDFNMLLLAIVNLLLFSCFGLLALNSAYEFYNQRHVPYMQDQLRKNKGE